MPSSGGGTGTPIGGGAPAGALVPRPLPHTLLSLERYAKFMGLNPAHFNQSYSLNVFPLTRSCSDVWYKYPWQKTDVVSREELSYAIHEAEYQIASVLGYWPAPKWTAREKVRFSQYHRPDFLSNGGHVLWDRKSTKVNYGKVIAAGQRAVALAEAGAAVAYSDEDSDGIFETGTITVDITGSAAKDIIDLAWDESFASTKNLKVYIEGEGGAQDWEVRSPISHSYSGTTVTIKFRSWQLIRPDLLEQFPELDEDPQPVDLNDTSNFVAEVDVYLEYTDRSATSIRLIWEENYSCDHCSGSGCPSCAPFYATGCAAIRDYEAGIFVPAPSTFADDAWTISTIEIFRDPNYAEIWYLSGAVSTEYEQGSTTDPLSHHFAQAITWLATARLNSPICACGNAKAISDDLRKDLAVVSPEGNFVVAIEEVMENPFGTRKGEVMAWRSIRRLSPKVLTGVAI